MFDGYLTNPITYDRLEQHFLDHFTAGIQATKLRAEDFRNPHYNVFFEDGTKDREANPIFSAKHLPSGNIVRIVIFDSSPEYSEVHKRVGDNDEKDELCLFITLPGMQRAMGTALAWAQQQAS
ncbi:MULTISPECIES: hypothetical protein [Stenotrophomonas]|uniref:Uncharacterized protein n=1 Tax=Stenotrophomonas lactitubi TaxID=2045214 RepID=A0AAW4GK39_9GAMM|nr:MULTISPECIES: hypothetical protein [Stenotrophomonas]MBM9914789.1 hypothetical protein [Stenotrophomonas lactitubi]MBM9923781.1 hypothetical protein [Stenotrophomonas lactitubi]MBM9939457.1 hypothetical protein [Stenotrophomonas lactitubi]